jgi:hypothetical protein
VTLVPTLQARPETLPTPEELFAQHSRFMARFGMSEPDATLHNATYKVCEGCLAAIYPQQEHTKALAGKLTGAPGACRCGACYHASISCLSCSAGAV